MKSSFPYIERPVSGYRARILNLVLALFISNGIVFGPYFAAAQEWHTVAYRDGLVLLRCLILWHTGTVLFYCVA